MTKKRRQKDVGTDEAVLPKPAPEKPKLAFEAWFLQQVKARKVREHQSYAIQTFFEKNGLSDFETAETYNRFFEKY